MDFPRFKTFKFKIEKTFKIPVHLNGRADLIATELYGNYVFYRPLCEANSIVIPYGVRVGIRPIAEAYNNELTIQAAADTLAGNKALSPTEIQNRVESDVSNRTESALDWNGYGDSSIGYVSDLYTDRILLVPSIDNCLSWLDLYGKIT